MHSCARFPWVIQSHLGLREREIGGKERTARSDAHCSTHAVIFITFQALGWNYLTAMGSGNNMVMFYFSVSAGHPASYNLEEQRTSVATEVGNIDLRERYPVY